MKYSAVTFFLLLLGISGAGCGGPEVAPEPSAEQQEPASPPEPEGKPFAILETDAGRIVIELLPELAPESVKQFVRLAEVGFYDRTAFHRLMKDRMIQGGDPLSIDNDPFNDGQGTAGEYIPQEFTDTPFERGTVAFGREAGSDNGGSCQFFICLTRTPEWDGQYNAFGRVVEGIEVAESISRAPLTQRDHPRLKFSPARKQVIRRLTIEYRPETA